MRTLFLREELSVLQTKNTADFKNVQFLIASEAEVLGGEDLHMPPDTQRVSDPSHLLTPVTRGDPGGVAQRAKAQPGQPLP